jgi:hypothetical protein
MFEEIMQKVVSGEMNLKQALEAASQPPKASQVQIVIAPRGWVFVGYTVETEGKLIITKANTIRVWGTSKGLGELVTGPTSSTKLDPCGTVRIPMDAVIALIDCEVSSWEKKL